MTRRSVPRTCTTFVRPRRRGNQSLETHWNRVSHESPVALRVCVCVSSLSSKTKAFALARNVTRVWARVCVCVCVCVRVHAVRTTYTQLRKYVRRWPRKKNPFTTGFRFSPRRAAPRTVRFHCLLACGRSTSTVTEGEEHRTCSDTKNVRTIASSFDPLQISHSLSLSLFCLYVCTYCCTISARNRSDRYTSGRCCFN